MYFSINTNVCICICIPMFLWPLYWGHQKCVQRKGYGQTLPSASLDDFREWIAGYISIKSLTLLHEALSHLPPPYQVTLLRETLFVSSQRLELIFPCRPPGCTAQAGTAPDCLLQSHTPLSKRLTQAPCSVLFQAFHSMERQKRELWPYRKTKWCSGV